MKKLLIVTLAMLLIVGMIASPAVAAKQVKWYVPGDFATIQEAIDSPDVQDGDIIMVGTGSFAGAFVDKGVIIKGTGQTIIDDGPLHPAGLTMGFRLIAGSDEAVISHLQFEVDLSIMNGAAVNNVTVEHCTFLNSIQAVSNWRGSGWTISHNDIVDLRTNNGGGIGILIADYTGGIVQDNIVSFNKISGTLYVDPNDGGGYNGSGIVLYADFRWGMDGASEMSNNKVIHNKISIVSDTPEVVNIAAFEMSENWYPYDPPDPTPIVIYNNAIGFNDFRGTTIQIDLTPDNLDDYNNISRNLGDNRGHGLHPSLFFK